jgi:DNA-binding NtrC family response regulator
VNEKVLFVDDDPGLLRLITSELKNEAIEILTEESGAGALRCIREQAPSAIVLDFLLPDMSCKEMILRIRQEHPTLPIVLLVPQGCISEATECLGQGALDYVQKPFECMRLRTSVRNAIKYSKLNGELNSLNGGNGHTSNTSNGFNESVFLYNGNPTPSCPDDIIPFEEEERRIILNALKATRWNVQEAAKRLKIGRATVYRKIGQFGLRRDRDNSDAA